MGIMDDPCPVEIWKERLAAAREQERLAEDLRRSKPITFEASSEARRKAVEEALRDGASPDAAHKAGYEASSLITKAELAEDERLYWAIRKASAAAIFIQYEGSVGLTCTCGLHQGKTSS